jgi:hypothetical protein
MENQHRKITGYRDLSSEEIDLMNRIKAKGSDLLSLQAELLGRLATDDEVKKLVARQSVAGKDPYGVEYTELTGRTAECAEYQRFRRAEPLRWAAIGKTEIQTGLMALVRAVAQPGEC